MLEPKDALILWDIDGTLVRGGTTAVAAHDRALTAVYQLTDEVARIVTSGMTDPQIVIETLALHNLTEASALASLDAFQCAYTDELGRVAAQLALEFEIVPGVRAVIDRLAALGVRQSLLTGNFESTARIKLASVGLDQHFDFAIGAFGSDHRDRNCLVPIALAKLAQTYGITAAVAHTIVIGDTPRDVACARASGARCVAVATGPHSIEELAIHEPDALLEDFAATGAVVSAVLRLMSGPA
ncbi:MAG: phosphoglycolate phosphatase [Chloroflexota bacterium]|nr:phosphoglycolate phosphatase [Chloroflexota bacterium]